MASVPDNDARVYEAVAAGKSASEVRRLIDEYGDDKEKRLAAVNKAAAAGPSGNNETPLQAAHRQRRGDLVGALVDAGADVGVLFEGRITPLGLCALYGQVDSVRALLRAGGHDANEKIRFASTIFGGASECTALHLCVWPRPLLRPSAYLDEYEDPPPKLGCIEALVREGGADVDARDSHGRTPLFCLCYQYPPTDRTAAIGLLIRLGADVEARDKFGQTPLCACASNTNLASLKLLLDHGASPNVSTREGFTPLSLACFGVEDESPSQREVVFALLPRSSTATRRALYYTYVEGLEEPYIDSTADFLVPYRGPVKHWHLEVIGELLASGVAMRPDSAAQFFPLAVALGTQRATDLEARLAQPQSWRAHEAMVHLALDAQEAREVDEAVEAARLRVEALEAAASSSSSSSSGVDESESEDEGEGGSGGTKDDGA